MACEIVEDDDIAWLEGRRENLLDIALKMSPFMAPSTTSGAERTRARKQVTNVDISQCPCGTAATSRCPRGARPYRRVMLVLAQVSSMKTNRNTNPLSG